MTSPAPPEWQAILAGLEKRLQSLADDGVGWLNIAAHPELATVLKDYMARAAQVSARPAQAPAPDSAPPGGSPPPASTTDASGATGATEATEATDAPPVSTAPTAPTGARIGESSAAEGSQPPATLESLRFQYRDCMACPLGASRNRLVFGSGASKPRLMFIGEGPGADEDQQGIPFVGRAGGLLTGLIKAVGLTREDVYITNVVKCRPPGNRNPQPDEAASCAPILERQIELLDPALIVTLGNVPLKYFNPGAAGITRERGRVFQYRNWPVLPTFHPSYLLRSPSKIRDCWADFRLALEQAYPEA